MLWRNKFDVFDTQNRYISAKLGIGASRFTLNVRQENVDQRDEKEQAMLRASASERAVRGAKEARGTRCRERERERERERMTHTAVAG